MRRQQISIQPSAMPELVRWGCVSRRWTSRIPVSEEWALTFDNVFQYTGM